MACYHLPSISSSGVSTIPPGLEEELKEVTLRTAPQDARFPTTNQARAGVGATCTGEEGKSARVLHR